MNSAVSRRGSRIEIAPALSAPGVVVFSCCHAVLTCPACEEPRPAPRKVAANPAIKPITSVSTVTVDTISPNAGIDKCLRSHARDIRSWADSVLGIANAVADLAVGAVSSRLIQPSHQSVVS